MAKKRVSELEAGDTLVLPGHRLHDDLAGLTVHLSVGALEPDGDETIVRHRAPEGAVWLPSSESVTVA